MDLWCVLLAVCDQLGDENNEDRGMIITRLSKSTRV